MVNVLIFSVLVIKPSFLPILRNLFFKTINFKENKNKIELKGLKLKFNKGYKINEFKNITLNYLTDTGINNDIKIINKNKNYFINGSVFDGTSMLKDLTESKTKTNIFENFDDLNSLIKVKISFADSIACEAP